jgi:hypothetical protein
VDQSTVMLGTIQTWIGINLRCGCIGTANAPSWPGGWGWMVVIRGGKPSPKVCQVSWHYWLNAARNSLNESSARCISSTSIPLGSQRPLRACLLAVSSFDPRKTLVAVGTVQSWSISMPGKTDITRHSRSYSQPLNLWTNAKIGQLELKALELEPLTKLWPKASDHRAYPSKQRGRACGGIVPPSGHT